MSDAVPVAAPAATVADVSTPAAPAAPVAPVENGAPLDAKTTAKRNLFKTLGEQAAARAVATPAVPQTSTPAKEPAVIDATGRAHAADGTFVAAPAATPATPPKAPEGIRIPVPEGHWLREQGATEWVARDENEARRVRGMFKDAARKSEVESLRERLIQTEAQFKAAQEARQSIVASPELLADIQYLRSPEVNRPDLADAIVAGLEAKQNAKAKDYEAEARQQFTEQDAVASVTAFRDTTIETARGKYPDFWVNSPRFQPALQQALFQYANEVAFEEQAGRHVKLSPEGVWKYLTPLYLEDPDAKRVAQQRLASRRPAPPVVSDAQARHATNSPLAAVSSANRTDRLSTTPSAADFKGMSADQIKRHLKDQFRTGRSA